MDDQNEFGATLRRERDAAEQKAWKALAGYKFWMFGYSAAWWVKLNQLCPGGPAPSPWKSLANTARRHQDQPDTRRKTERDTADPAADDAATAEPSGQPITAEPDPPLQEPGRG